MISTVSQEMWEGIILITSLTLCGMGMVVLILMDAVVKLGCHGFIRICLSKKLGILKFTFVKMRTHANEYIAVEKVELNVCH